MAAMDSAPSFRSGFVALVGRPNSGKSTLLNQVLGEELSIVTPLPQTTRRRIKGVYTRDNLQIVFIDTPGIHRGGHQLNEVMLEEAAAAITESGIDCLCYLVDLSRDFGEEEALVASMVQKAKVPLLLVFNKIDRCQSVREQIEKFSSLFPNLAKAAGIAISAKNAGDAKRFLAALDRFIPEGPRYFDDETLSDVSMRFFAAEFIRKQIILSTREEVPHAVFVEIETYHERENLHEVGAVIHVETMGQKGIIIGPKGTLIEKIRKGAEHDLGRLAGCRARISCHVKVSPHWRDDKGFLRNSFSG